MKRLKALIVLWGAALVIAGCALPLGEDYLLTRDGSDDITYIADYNLQTYVPIPKTGEGPVILVDNREDLDIKVEWTDNATGMKVLLPFERFEAGTVYQAEISVTVKSGYGFYPSMSFAYPDGKIAAQNDDLGTPTRIIRVTYNNSDDWDKTFITDYNLQNYVLIPLAGEEPGIPNRSDVTVGVIWNPLIPSGGFAIGTVYQATISLATNPGYYFNTAKPFEYPAGTVIIQPQPNHDSENRALTPVTYMATRAPTEISDLNLTPYIPKPINGAMGLTSFAGPQYTGRVAWKNTVTGEQVGAFQAGVEYTAEVALTPAMGYAFTGVKQNGFIHTGAGTVTNPANKGDIRIGFSATPSVGGPTIIYDTNLTGRIPRPVSGESPVQGITGTQYTGAVTWMPAPHSTFQYGTAYTAVIALNAAPGYTFTGIGQNAFVHGDGAASNPAGNGTVTIAFPQTASATYSVITSFGPVEAEGSALKLMKEKKNDNGLTIDLPDDMPELVDPDRVILVAGDNSPAKVVINGHNGVLTIGGQGTLLTVGGGVTLTLQNITLQGINGNNAPLVKVQHGGKLLLGAGAVITGNQTSSDAGGVWINGGELVLNPGSQIKGMVAQRGGGVLVDNNGRLSMNGGTIGGALPADGNTASGVNGGGGVLVMGGSFYMLGGTIQSNTAEAGSSGGGVGIFGNGIFNLHEGTIKGNRALGSGPGAESGGGVLLTGVYSPGNGYISIGRFNMYGGTIGGENPAEDANTAGIGANGVYVIDGRFTMSGGEITGNTNGTDDYGVFYSQKGGNNFTMMGTARIDEYNKVFLAPNTLITIGGGLSASPAANIIMDPPPASGTTRLLEASSSGLITGNYGKFQYDDITLGDIIVYDSGYGPIWGVYKE
jgi:hypothetical protein